MRLATSQRMIRQAPSDAQNACRIHVSRPHTQALLDRVAHAKLLHRPVTEHSAHEERVDWVLSVMHQLHGKQMIHRLFLGAVFVCGRAKQRRRRGRGEVVP